ncbi:putative Acyl carrier protein phosphodiesterase [Vibrio nigripulchritudo SOn1]|uniref:FMN dependent NADH:quinone oxidoreductase n=1 Tax=Vibrio nigripulchritudo SOn1 TaxID=1238450 RepID=A0AAV2VLQ1_9VIBR|nr:NAD(P)H-dependent oxidoreductase [Vibrio nigripulchritudo]CCO45575.1 putative Acyl carrier protein phosphodiesterase [Vibrio nigripulchritudo SOn1]
MITLLQIDASPRQFSPEPQPHQSVSRRIAHHFVSEIKKNTKINNLIVRDLAVNPPPFIDIGWISESFSDEKKDSQTSSLAISDELIAEVEAADIIVISSPMYNYGMPAVLKAWFDQVIRVNKTFSFDSKKEPPIEPILSGKIVILCTSSGEYSFGKGESQAHKNHLGAHIEQLSPYLGADHFHEIASEYQEFKDKRHDRSLENAINKAKALAHQYAK